MAIRTLEKITTLPIFVHVVLAVGAMAGFRAAKNRLDASYIASGHPVDYVVGQTSFSGPQIKEYYAVMTEGGTLDVYRTTQMIDFGFIAAIAALGLFLSTVIARLSRDRSWGYHVGLWSGVALIAGALCDAIENLISFVMLSDPAGFADWLAYPYSAFAVAKFALITLGMSLALLSLLLAAAGRVIDQPGIG